MTKRRKRAKLHKWDWTSISKKEISLNTPEPDAAYEKNKDRLRFVIQRHRATRLHYDLRLEMEGVLKSWAVPKGPSMNPADKRLAIRPKTTL